MSVVYDDSPALTCKLGDIKIISEIGEGGQGKTYVVEIQNKQYAMKYYSKEYLENDVEYDIDVLLSLRSNYIPNKNWEKTDPEFRKNKFIWPICKAFYDDEFVGYIMPLLEPRFTSITSLIGGDNGTFVNFKLLIKTCLNLVMAFDQMYNAKLAYKDISSDNIYYDPKTGDVMIIDNDNVTLDDPDSVSNIQGTLQFMAPELIITDYDDKDNITVRPTRTTDLHALAVLLFEMLVGVHPLEGKKLDDIELFSTSDEDLAEEVYSKRHASFIFEDENNTKRYINVNKPEQLLAETIWNNILTPKIRELFMNVFSSKKGIIMPSRRTSTTEWLNVFSALLNRIITCDCGEQFVYSEEEKTIICKRCNKEIPIVVLQEQLLDPRFTFLADKLRRIVLQKDINIYAATLEIVGDEFADMQPVIQPVFISNKEYKLKNISGIKVIYNGDIINKDEETGVLQNGDKLTLDDKEFIVKII